MTATLLPNGHEVVTLLTLQRDLYLRLRELAGQQRELISGAAPEVLLNLLTERQTIVNRLARLNEQLAPYRRNWEATYASLPLPARDAATALLAEINALLRTILQTDEQDGALLAARRQQTAREISALDGRRNAAAAYAGARSAGTSGIQG
jgi:hypothetical protein